MKSLLSVSLCLLLICCSCAPSITRDCRKGETLLIGKEQLLPMVDASAGLCKYNMTIDFMRKHFSGLLLVKETDQEIIQVHKETVLQAMDQQRMVKNQIQAMNQKLQVMVFYQF